MSALYWVVAAAVAALSLAAHVTVLARSAYLRMHIKSYLGALAAGATLFVPVTLLELFLQSWAQIDPIAQAGGQVTLLLYALLVRAPLEMGLVTLAVWPFWRLRRLRMRAGLARALETKEGLSFAVSSALGFGLARAGFFLWHYPGRWVALAQAALWLAAFLLLCAGWGFALGRNAQRGMRGRRFTSAWLGATIMSAVCDQLAFRRGVGAMVAMIPLVVSMLAIAFVAWRDLRLSEGSSGGKLSSFIASAPAPSLDAIRDAFRRESRPLTLRWIIFGGFVTTGMITTGLIAAVWLGHEIGLDFSAVEREAGPDAVAPLALLGIGALAAFPGSGYLLARASRAHSVLEPAMSSALAMVLMMIFMGLLAPVSIVFAVAFAPVGFGLACIGAWIGMGA